MSCVVWFSKNEKITSMEISSYWDLSQSHQIREAKIPYLFSIVSDQVGLMPMLIGQPYVAEHFICQC